MDAALSQSATRDAAGGEGCVGENEGSTMAAAKKARLETARVTAAEA